MVRVGRRRLRGGRKRSARAGGRCVGVRPRSAGGRRAGARATCDGSRACGGPAAPARVSSGRVHPRAREHLHTRSEHRGAERGAPRRVDPYTDRTSRLPDVASPMEHTGSWPPADAQSARSMDQNTRGNESWEDLFEPDELPPPRAATPVVPSLPETPDRPAPRPGRFDRLVTPATPSEPAAEPDVADDLPSATPKPEPRSEPPPSFMGHVPSPPSKSESTGSVRRAKRPRRD